MLQHAPRELSNGQKQRTALARALVADPRILLLDDPLRNVDAKLRYEMRLELPSLLKASGSTVLYVTQDYKEAMALGDRIAVLLDGGFVADRRAAARSIANRRRSASRACSAIRRSIVIPAEPSLRDGEPVFELGGASLSLPARYAHAAGDVLHARRPAGDRSSSKRRRRRKAFPSKSSP